MERLQSKDLTGAGARIGSRVECLEAVDSTNNYVKILAEGGEPQGLVVTAEVQTAGRGRQGRSFVSPQGKGLYLSALLRPRSTPEQATDLTAWVAVAAARAVEKVCGLASDIKWVNDLQVEGKKLCGILCEMGMTGNRLDYVVAGIGINVSQNPEDFPPEVAGQATSLGQWLNVPPSRTELARALIEELDRVCGAFPEGKQEYLEQYRVRCVTPGREVWVLNAGERRQGFALGIDEAFRLEVEFEDGRVEALSTGEVSVRPVDKASPQAL